jgi:hypothetical protein
MSDLKGSFATPSYYDAALASDWGRAIGYAREVCAGQVGGERFVTALALANLMRQAGESECACNQIEKAWASAPSLGRSLSDPRLLQCATLAEMVGLVEISYEAISSMHAATVDPFSSAIMAERLRQAHEYAQALSGRRTRVVPLGEQCLPYSILMRWGFREFSVESPFIAGVFTGAGPALALEDDFGGFCAAEHYKVIRSPEGKEMPTIPRYRASLNHEIGPYFCGGSKEPLVLLYRRRVANFRAAMQAGGPVVLLIERTALADIPCVMAAATAAYPHVNLRFLVFDYEEDEREPDDEVAACQDPRLSVLSTPQPCKEYIWHHPEWQNTEIGLAWEAPMAAALAHAIGSYT